MKKLLSILLISCVLLTLTACGSEKTLNGSIDDLFKKIEEKNAEGAMYACSAEVIEEDFLIKESYYSEGRIIKPEDSAGVERIAFFKANSAENANLISKALKKHIEDVKQEEKNYNADNYATASNAEVTKEGLYVYMVMSPNKAAITEVIKANLK
ncbi:DUF4358 domain-containing protein [Eubacteriales bacterium OttesenSCG-928-G02]|nr:DUF4358 domain-containing protein [Eubacteriales bacterium OttesenSCG-928-G02]